MPIYAIQCLKCGKKDEIFRSVSEYDNLPNCCETKMERKISPAMVMDDIQPYKSMINGQMIMSRSQHRNHLKEHGCIEIGNEKQTVKPVTPPAGLKDKVIKAAYQHGLLRS